MLMDKTLHRHRTVARIPRHRDRNGDGIRADTRRRRHQSYHRGIGNVTTIFGIIAALVLQVFYNYIVSKIDHITADMEESAIKLLDSIGKYKNQKG